MTCLLGFEQGVDVFFGVKGVDDVLAGVEQGAYGGVYGDGAVDGFFHGFSAVFALLQVVPELSAIFWSLDDEEFFVVRAPLTISPPMTLT